ncbi:MAG: helix-turn-helix transcriptional regulator [Bacteroidota bacterium]
MPFHFSQYSSLLLFGFLQGIIYAVLLLYGGYKRDRLSDKLLALVLLDCAFAVAQYMLGFGGWYDSRDGYSTFMFYFPFHNFLLLGPFIYFYFRSLTNHQFQFQRRDWWHFVPGGINLLAYFVAFAGDLLLSHWLLGEPLPNHFGTQGQLSSIRQQSWDSIAQVAGLISTLAYIILTIREFGQYKQYIYNNFAETEGIEFGWLRMVLWAFIIGMGINWLFDFLQLFIPLNYAQNWNSFFVTAIMIYFISIPGYTASHKIPSLDFSPEAQQQNALQPKTNAVEDFPALEHWKSQVEYMMQEEKVYLDPNITLTSLAKKLKTNPSVLSKVINTGFKKNFNDFINQYRVEDVQAKIKRGKHQHFTLMSIAFDSGFNSKSTFNRAFKKFAGMSPKQFLDQQLNELE